MGILDIRIDFDRIIKETVEEHGKKITKKEQKAYPSKTQK